jgi:hypothetical protein
MIDTSHQNDHQHAHRLPQHPYRRTSPAGEQIDYPWNRFIASYLYGLDPCCTFRFPSLHSFFGAAISGIPRCSPPDSRAPGRPSSPPVSLRHNRLSSHPPSRLTSPPNSRVARRHASPRPNRPLSHPPVRPFNRRRTRVASPRLSPLCNRPRR